MKKLRSRGKEIALKGKKSPSPIAGCKYSQTLYREQKVTMAHTKLRHMKKQIIIQMVAGLFILLWLYAAFTKLAGFGGFVKGLQHFPVIGWAAWPVAVMIPGVEIGLSILLFFPGTRGNGFRYSLWLMCLFTLYIGSMVAFVPERPCGCGGILQSLSWPQHLMFNILLTGLAYTGFRMYKSHVVQKDVP